MTLDHVMRIRQWRVACLQAESGSATRFHREHVVERQTPPIVVIGASAGGIQALVTLVAELPADIPAAILVVVHIGRARSTLPTVLARAGMLPASHAGDGERIEAGRISIAPPDQHLLVQGPFMSLTRGPKENHSRPAIDPLFRSAAVSYGPRAIGIILSGALSDGAVGLQMIKSHGGTAIVQDPADALVESMPASALRNVHADHILTAREIGVLLATDFDRLISRPEEGSMPFDESGARTTIDADKRALSEDRLDRHLTMYTCPDCGGTLWQVDAGDLAQFHCHIGHVWGADALLRNKSVELETALWSSVRLLEERAVLTRQVASQIREANGGEARARDIDEQAELDEQRASVIRSVLESPLNRTLALAEDEPSADAGA